SSDLAVWLLAPPDARAYSLIGGSLSTSQRDVRVFDNFSDAAANDNTTPSPSFPGALGAELAIWKAVVEWQSELHGGGYGDPTQVGGLGSGGANFDPSWQGNAASVGSPNDNVHSEESGSDSGVLAYCETPISDGWRIRYYSVWTWADGPDAGFGGTDLQGIACHEYGHALGLGHSNDLTGATMFPSIGGNGSLTRSIEPDDIAGIKAIYGVKSASKPRIASTQVTGATLVINGANFTSTGNEVWFTRAGGNTTGEPVKVTGLASTNGGTKLTLTIPATAGDGDVLVKKNASGGSSLSNAFPFDREGGPLVGGPQLSSVTPSSVPVLALPASTFQIGGTGLSSTSSVTVGGVAASFTKQGDTGLTIEVPLLGALGAVSVVVTNQEGPATTTLGIVAPTAPVLLLDPPLMLNGQTLTATLGAGVGDIVYLCASTTFAPTVVPGILSLDIGGGIGGITVLSTKLIPAKGWTTFTSPTLGMPAGTSVYGQLAVFSAANPGLPLGSSNFQSTLVVF
ncbi:MAG: matrixin family metalloprotease, partial [Planctomycetota bacterium]